MRNLSTLSIIALSAVAAAQTTVTFTQGVNGYTGTQDTRIRLTEPDRNFGTASVAFTDFPATDADHDHSLLRFDGFQSAIGSGKKVRSAYLKLSTSSTANSNSPGHGGRLFRMNQDWAQDTATWNSFGGGLQMGSQLSNIMTAQAGALAIATGTGTSTSHVGGGRLTLDVSRDVQDILNGGVNYGWGFLPIVGGGNGWAFATSEWTNQAERPTLEVTYEDAQPWTNVTEFQQGLNGYMGAEDVTLSEDAAFINQGANDRALVDFTGTSGLTSHTLIKFNDIFGTNLPSDAVISRAVLSVQAYGSNAPGDGGTLHRVLQGWNEGSAAFGTDFNGDGVQGDDSEAVAAATASFGSSALTPNVEWGQLDLDVTADVLAWQNGADNHGWAMVPWLNGSDAYQFITKEHGDVILRPKLSVYWAPVPEPGTMAVLGLGALALLRRRRSR